MRVFSNILRKPKKLGKDTVLATLSRMKHKNADYAEVSFIGIYESIISEFEQDKFDSLIGNAIKAMSDTDMDDSSWYQRFCNYCNILGKRNGGIYSIFSSTIYADHKYLMKEAIEQILQH